MCILNFLTFSCETNGWVLNYHTNKLPCCTWRQFLTPISKNISRHHIPPPKKKKERKKEKKRKQSWNQKLSTCKLLDIFLSQGPLWGRRSKKAGCYEEGTFHYNFELCITLIKVKLYHSGQIRTIFAYLVGIPEVGEKVGVDCWLNKKNLKKRSLKQTKCLEICKSYMNFTT